MRSLLVHAAFLAAALAAMPAFAQYAMPSGQYTVPSGQYAAAAGQVAETNEARIQRLHYEQGQLDQLLRSNISRLEKSDPNYAEKLDRILRQMIAVDSPVAIDFCIPNMTNPHANDLTTHFGVHHHAYLRHLSYRGGIGAIRMLLTHVTKTKLSKEEHEEYLYYSAYLLACQCEYKESKLLKYREILVEDYSPELIDRVIKIAVPMKAGSR